MKIIHEREKCIGCGACAVVCSRYWQMAEDGKSKLLGANINQKTGNYELLVERIECNQEAADSCPVNIIHIKSKK